MFTAGILLGTVSAPPGRHFAPGGFDESGEGYFNQAAASRSDTFLVLSAGGIPIASHWGLGVDRSLTNATFVYGEAHGVAFALNNILKLAVRRPRPYVAKVSESPQIAAFYESEGSDAYRSFYSGHASAAFTSATASSILFSLRADDPATGTKWQRRVMWGTQFGVAGMVADLRVVAGRHYRTDVLVGMLAGVGIGVAVPAAHDLDLRQVTAEEVAFGAGAAALGFAGVELYRALFPGDFDARRPALGEVTRFTLLPAQLEGNPGAMLVGEF